MAWQTQSRRRAELPADWPIIRRTVLDRDHHTCQLRGRRCTGVATHVDHINPTGPHTLDNLRAACQACHMTRTAAQSHAARPALRRQPTRHPGLL